MVYSTYVVQKAKLLNYFATSIKYQFYENYPDDWLTGQSPDSNNIIDNEIEK